MAIKSFAVLCIFLICNLFIACDSLPTTRNLFHRLQKRSGLRLCGRVLVEALAAICQSEYYAPGFKRRFEYNSRQNLDPESYPTWDQTYSEGVAELEPLADSDFINTNQLSRRGIADECCSKSCSFNQLVSYCSTTPRI